MTDGQYTAQELGSQAAAALALRRRRRDSERSSFNGYCKAVTPKYQWDWPHLLALQAQFERITSGAIDRLIVSMPPRHGKTETKVRYAAYRIERCPTTRIIVVSYNQTLAEKISRKIRRILTDRGMVMSLERNSAQDWENTEGGGVRAVGIGSGVAGTGADLLLIDDPVKSREVADSPTFQERTWDCFRDDLMTRLEPKAAVILTMTRWHHLDLAGKILSDESAPEYQVLNLPALAESEDDPLRRTIGEALCPERYDTAALLRIKAAIGEYGFAALFQGHPTPRSGNMFPRGLALIVDAVPAVFMRWARGWDKAGTKDGGKRTAGVKIGVAPDGLIYVTDTVVGQWAARERELVMRQAAELDGPYTAHVVEQEPGSGGKDSMLATVMNLSGFQVVSKIPVGDKATRANALAAQWQAGNVRILRGRWNEAFLDEMAHAPSGTFSDRMDASALAYNHLALHVEPKVRSLTASWA